MRKFMIGTSFLVIGLLAGCSNPEAVPVQPENQLVTQEGTEPINVTDGSIKESGTVGEAKSALEGNSTTSNTTENMITEGQAREVALKQVPGGKILAIDKDFNDLVPNYDFTIVKDNMEYEFEVNAYDGSIRAIEKDMEIVKGTQAGEAELIGEERARAIAQEQVPTGEITEFAYESDEYIPNYDISISDGTYEYDFEIHAMTGEILRSEKDLLD